MSNMYTKSVRVEIPEETMARLLDKGQACAADFQCLDDISKKCLWRLCLESCARRMRQIPEKMQER